MRKINESKEMNELSANRARTSYNRSSKDFDKKDIVI